MRAKVICEVIFEVDKKDLANETDIVFANMELENLNDELNELLDINFTDKEITAYSNEKYIDYFDSQDKRSIFELEILPRVSWHLSVAGIVYVDDLVNLTEADIVNIRGLGRYSLDNIKNALANEGLSLKK